MTETGPIDAAPADAAMSEAGALVMGEPAKVDNLLASPLALPPSQSQTPQKPLW